LYVGYGEQRNAVYENRLDAEVSEPELTPRPEPLRDFPVDQVLDVTDFDAVPDDEENDVAGIRAAMKQAAEADVLARSVSSRARLNRVERNIR
jgi:hypothetical protein